MTNKISRNDKCPCGSGKKHKACCLSKTASNTGAADFAYRKLRQLEGALIDKHLMPYVTKQLPTGIMVTASRELYTLEDLPEELDTEELFTQLFMTWFLFNWTTDADINIASFDPSETIAWNYLNTYGNRLTSAEKEFIETINQTYYSFYSIVDVEFDRHLVVKDVLLGIEHLVKERQGTHDVKRGNIIFGRILTLNGQTIFVGTAPFQVPPRYHMDLIQFRKWLIEEHGGKPLDVKMLREELEYELFDYYFDIMKSGFSDPLPELCNTDGESIQFSRSRFKLAMSIEEAVGCLLPLTLLDTLEERLSKAERDRAGAIIRVEMPWLKEGNPQHKDWNNTVMGHITIEKNRLTLETNSQERTQQGKNVLKRYLGEAVQFQQTLIESPTQKIGSLPKSAKVKSTQSEELLQDPAVQEQIKEMAKNHWENWFEQPIPALDNKTPHESAKTAEGRELLSALLAQYEDFDQHNTNLFKADVHYLRERLSLN